MSERVQPAKILPPELVDAIRVREPSFARERRVDVAGSNEIDELKTSKPANAPARPTLPMRSKSTWGKAARASWHDKRRASIRGVEKRFIGNSCSERLYDYPRRDDNALQKEGKKRADGIQGNLPETLER